MIPVSVPVTVTLRLALSAIGILVITLGGLYGFSHLRHRFPAFDRLVSGLPPLVARAGFIVWIAGILFTARAIGLDFPDSALDALQQGIEAVLLALITGGPATAGYAAGRREE